MNILILAEQVEKAKIEQLLIGLPSFSYNFLTDDASKEIEKDDDEDLDEEDSEEGDSDVDKTAEFEGICKWIVLMRLVSDG